MKKILIGLLSLFGVFLLNFSSAGTLTYNGTLNCSYSNCSSPVFSIARTINDSDYSLTIDCSFSNFVGNGYFYSSNAHFDYFVNNLTSQAFTFDNSLITTNSGFSVVYSKNSQGLLMRFVPTYYNGEYSFDYSCSFSSDKILSSGTYYLNCPTCDYSEYESQINTLSGSLASCQSSLNSCQSPGSCSVNDKISDNIIFSGSKSFSNAGYTNMFNYGDYGAGTYCLKFTSSNAQTLTMGFANGGTTAPSNLYSLYNDQYGNWICLYGNKPYLNVKLNSNSNTISYEVYKLTDLLSSFIPCSNGSSSSSCDTGSILSGYILESSVNQQYCVNNNLCPVVSCDYSEYESQISSLSGSLNSCQNSLGASSTSLVSCQNSLSSCLSANCPAVGVSWSSLFINDIQHLGASNIYMTIPEEFDRDYSYSNSGENMEIDIEGYNVDYDKINGLVSLQSYKPTSEDFTKLVSNLGGYFKILVFLLFGYILIKWIKNIFKSKKL